MYIIQKNHKLINIKKNLTKPYHTSCKDVTQARQHKQTLTKGKRDVCLTLRNVGKPIRISIG